MSGVDLEGSKLFCRIDMVKKDILTQTQVSVTVYMVPAVLVMREREREFPRPKMLKLWGERLNWLVVRRKIPITPVNY